MRVHHSQSSEVAGPAAHEPIQSGAQGHQVRDRDPVPAGQGDGVDAAPHGADHSGGAAGSRGADAAGGGDPTRSLLAKLELDMQRHLQEAAKKQAEADGTAHAPTGHGSDGQAGAGNSGGASDGASIDLADLLRHHVRI
jgi:hypothetical protein